MRLIERLITRTVLALAIVAVAAPRATAQFPIPVLVEGLSDWELWSTTANSNLLTRNAGRWEGIAHAQLWGAMEPLPGLVFYGQGEFYAAGLNSQTRTFDSEADQFGVRYIAGQGLVIDAGKLQPVVGTFASRRFSNRNPLIGSPDGYSLVYPYGVEISGEQRFFDYRAALITLPPSHADYVPPPTPRLRPAIGAGITPFVGFRIGGSFSDGPYLNNSFTPAQLHDASWTSFHQRVIAADVSFAKGYLETHAEAARGSYDVPGRAGALMGYTYYGEAKYTFTPRFFVATRLERNNYPFIRVFGTNTTWTARLTDFVDGELGVGYRFDQTTLVKASVRADRWWVPVGSSFRGQGGPALAMQVSKGFDALSWFRRAK